MGIRFERDSRKATNGPLIFFSILHDEAFEEEIRGAFISGLSFYAYRAPGATMLTFGSSEGYVEGIGEPGFVIGFFDPEKPYITIPYKGTKKTETSTGLYLMPYESTPYDDYKEEVEGIIGALKDKPGSKVVAARVVVKDGETDIAEKFYDLCEKFPKAYVFCFGTPATGCWIGASPELLLESQDNVLHTMALAGTRKIIDQTWDHKNIEEQRIVTEYISDTFKDFNIEPVLAETFSKPAGIIEHICTPISGLKPENLRLEALLRKLSPTPALCGQPKAFALEEIKKYERFDRGCYGGFCGPFHSGGDFTFNVVLRCASVAQQKICIYVGGGITIDSKVESEWEETNLKMNF